jgi:hypothetical protein
MHSGVSERAAGILNGWEVTTMLDLVFVLATAVAFGVAILYVRGCERLR